jgi:hypothetical protein
MIRLSKENAMPTQEQINDERRIEAAFAAFLEELDDDRDVLTFPEEDAIRAAIKAYEEWSE